MTDAKAVWLGVLQEIAGRSAHEIKGSLNGVSLSLEVVRSRSAKPGNHQSVSEFATAAAEHLELLTGRVEALLWLSREPRPDGPADINLAMKHLAALLVPAAKADGGSLGVEGLGDASMTSVSVTTTRLALAGGLLALIKEGGMGTCRLTSVETAVDKAVPVVRFSHESAGACSLAPAIASTVTADGVTIERTDRELTLVFPRYR